MTEPLIPAFVTLPQPFESINRSSLKKDAKSLEETENFALNFSQICENFADNAFCAERPNIRFASTTRRLESRRLNVNRLTRKYYEDLTRGDRLSVTQCDHLS